MILSQEIASEQYGVGFALDNTKLRDQVNEVLKEMAEDGTMAAVSKKWFGEDITIIDGNGETATEAVSEGVPEAATETAQEGTTE